MSLRYDAHAYCADINHHICQCKKNSGIILFALSDNLISEVWFFAEGEWLLWLSGKLVGIGVYFSKSVQEELFVHYSPE